jgi:HEAT repeat protein
MSHWPLRTLSTRFAPLAVSSLLACTLAAIPACESPSKPTSRPASTTSTQGTTAPGQSAPAILTPTKDYNDPVIRSGLREQAIETILASGRSRDASVRANATECALLAPSRLEPLVAAGLKDDNLGVRSVSAVVAGKGRFRTLTPAIRPLISDSSPYVRASAIFGLRRCGDVVDPSPLSSILFDDPSPKVRAHVAYLLGEMDDKSAIGMLRAAARKPMPRAAESEIRLYQLQIAEALVKLGDESQIHSIRAALYPSRLEELEATALAVQIIGTLKDHGAKDQLMFLSGKQDKDGGMMPAEIRLGIASSMAQLGNRNGAFIAQEFWNSPTPVLRGQTAMVFGYIGRSDGLVYLERLLADTNENVRVAAAAGILRTLGAQ